MVVDQAVMCRKALCLWAAYAGHVADALLERERGAGHAGRPGAVDCGQAIGIHASAAVAGVASGGDCRGVEANGGARGAEGGGGGC
eukprot:765485-Hanusia_phi.AAC.2